jgi:hypothetical protein
MEDWLFPIIFVLMVLGVFIGPRLQPRSYADLETEEERVETLAFSKALQFAFLNVIFALFGALPFFLGLLPTLTERGLGWDSHPIAWMLIIGAIEFVLLLIACAMQPPVPKARIPAFSRRGLFTTFAILSSIPTVFALEAATFNLLGSDKADFRYWHYGIDGVLLLVILAFFVINSVMAKSFRFAILLMGLIPLVNLIFGALWARAYPPRG